MSRQTERTLIVILGVMLAAALAMIVAPAFAAPAPSPPFSHVALAGAA